MELTVEKLLKVVAKWGSTFIEDSTFSLWYFMASTVGVVILIYLLYLYYTPVNRVRVSIFLCFEYRSVNEIES